jgi:shikimate kinase
MTHETPNAKRENIFLIGCRGVGKTSVARLLAEPLGWNWVDADAVLEASYGRSIRALFSEEGEAAFRDMEAQVLEELCCRRRQVIATGGGVVLRAENRERLRASGWVVWLTADAATLWHRVQADATTAERRPNLSGGGPDEVVEVLRQREPWYRCCADLIVSTVGLTPQEVMGAILAGWRLA